MDSVLTISDMHKTYAGGVHAVRGVSFEVNEGESVAIIGSSGSGKSTVLRCINRLIEPTEGEVRLRGDLINTPSADINNVRSRIGMVFQSFELFSHLRVIDNITLGLRHVRKMSKKDAESEALEVLEKVDMLDRKDAFPGNLSGGQKQRVAIARALAVNPAVLLMDEPLSALDSQTRELLLEDFVNLWCRKPFTAVYITHNLSEAVRLGHKIIVLSRRPGKIIETINIEKPISDRKLIDKDLDEYQKNLWNIMHDEARAADAELLNV